MGTHKVGDLLLAFGGKPEDLKVLGVINKYLERSERYDILWVDDYVDGSGLYYSDSEINIFKCNLQEYLEGVRKDRL